MQNVTFKRSLLLFIAQGAYAGRAPVAPGTAGSFVGILVYLFLNDLSYVWYGVACAVVIVAGTWSAGHSEVLLGKKDDPSIVIDEIAGMLISLFSVPAGWAFLAGGFILFRFFDIVKPWPIRRLQDLTGGIGVMADDLAAGIYANLALQIVTVIAGSS